MARRIRLAALIATLVAIAVFALPLALAVHRIYLSDAYDQLERTALRAAVTVDTNLPPGDAPDPLPTVGSTSLALYDTSGRRLVGAGPNEADSLVSRALNGEAGDGREAGDLVVAVPVAAGESVRGAVRAEASTDAVWRRTLATWTGMGLLALVAAAGSILVARSQARRINQPLVELADAAQRLGDGDFASRTTPAGIAEVDRAGAALNATAERLGELMARERDFTSNASHQLRTPLTGLRLQLEAGLTEGGVDAQTALRNASTSADELERTVNDLLAHARPDPSVSVDPVDLRQVFDDLEERWHGRLAAAGRRLVVRVDPEAHHVLIPEYAIRQALEVLMDNASVHGRGQVTVLTREATGAVAVDVSDEGPGLGHESATLFTRSQHDGASGEPLHGIGLAMAQELVGAHGGRVVVGRRDGGATLTVLLRGAPAPQRDKG